MIRVAFLLLPGFDLAGFGLAAQALHLADKIGGRPVYRRIVVTESGSPAVSGCGIPVPGQAIAGETVAYDRLLLVAGDEPPQRSDPGLLAWLRHLARHGVQLGCSGGGAWPMAAAGLLQGRHVALPRRLAAAFSETFPDPLPISRPYVVEADRMSCRGGLSLLDLILDLISRDLDATAAGAVAERLGHRWTGADQERPLSAELRLAVPNRKLATCIELMRANVEAPLDSPDLARAVGLSVRHLERLFLTHLGTTPKRFYRTVRLEHARRLLSHTDLAITEVALATGFASASHFARVFRQEYKVTPRSDRQSRERPLADSVRALI